ncbi:MAG: zinc ribbon domain-containing protein [candidate division WOR-3 bacterium]
MPLYDFECLNCKKTFEDLIMHYKKSQKICCPNCGSKNVKRLISLFGVAGTEKKVSSSSCHNCSTKNCSSCK